MANEPRRIRRSKERAAGARPFPSVARVRRRTISDADYQAFLSSAGGWKGLVDTDQLKADIAHSRRIGSRPPVKL